MLIDRSIQYEKESNAERMYFKILLLFQTALILLGVAEAYEKYKIVETDDGPIRGVRNFTLLNGMPFYSYKGIPYAKAPTGELRFKVNIFSRRTFFECVIRIFNDVDRPQNQLIHGNRKFSMH